MGTVQAPPASVTLANGESRVVEATYSNGYECPWCFYPVRADESACANPACDTWLSVDGIAARRADQAKRAEAAEAAERLRRFDAAQRERAAERDLNLWRELSARAEEGGQCVKCLRRSYWRSAPKFVKHRPGTVCPNDRR